MPGLRQATATTVTAFAALRIERAEKFRALHEEHASFDLFLTVSAGLQYTNTDRSRRSAFQHQRKVLSANPLIDGRIRQAGRTRIIDPADHAGNPGRNDRHHPVPRQLLHEPLPQAWLIRIQRLHLGAQIAAQYDFARSITGA